LVSSGESQAVNVAASAMAAKYLIFIEVSIPLETDVDAEGDHACLGQRVEVSTARD
jgi:hypothetical protein